MNLGDVRRKADQLGFDVTIRDTGHLVISKHGNSMLFFISGRSLDDPRTVFDAMIWLEKQYATQRILEMYLDPLVRKRRRRQVRAVVLWLILSAVAVDAWSQYHLLPAGAGITIFFVLLILFCLVLDPIKLRRDRGN